MTEAPERISVTFNNWRNPNAGAAYLNDAGDTEYIRADLARPMTVAEAAKLLLADADAVATITRGIQAQYSGRVLISQSGVSDGLRALSQGGE